MAVVRAQEASSSTSSGCSNLVFVSFRGKDTRTNFTSHLYTALVQAGLYTFIDDEGIERGESLMPELEKAIKQSRSSIIVFSKDYASSQWCLDELVMILDRRSSSRQYFVLPVFYDVRPSEIRNQKTGRTADAFAGYEEQIEAETDDGRKNELMKRVKGWRKALGEVADLAGMELQNKADRNESKFIQKIVNMVSDKLSRTVLNVTQLFGIDSQVKRINSCLQDASTDTRVIAICGMGGIGKTTLANIVYNQNFGRFDGSSYLTSVRERSRETNGLVELQRQLLLDILNIKRIKIVSVDHGVTVMKERLCNKKVLLVLDDVDDDNQLNALAGMRGWLFPGSKIIITTRREDLVNSTEVYKKHRVQKLCDDESIKLFSLYAFGKERPMESYKELTRRVVEHCDGLPLALRVLGSSLNGRNAEVWDSALERLGVTLNPQIHDILVISYDALEDDYDKVIFLHIACFFAGRDKDWTIRILDCCDLQALCGTNNLIDRCLLEVDSDNNLMMHQLIRDMGREIVRKESFDEPGKRSRLWNYKDCLNVLTNKTGTETVRGLVFHGNNVNNLHFEEFLDSCSSIFSWQQEESNSNDGEFDTDALSRMHNLSLLQLDYVGLTGCYKEFPKRLKWLCLHGFRLSYVPNDLPLESLVYLDMQYSRLKQVWKGTKFLRWLKILDLSHSQELARTPNFRGLPNLERLILKGCVSLLKICESIESLKELVLLDLKDCKNIRKLPRNIHMLISLKTLIISGCINIGDFPTEMRNMESLKVVYADGISINTPVNEEINRWQALVSAWMFKPTKGPRNLLASLPHFLVVLSLVHCNLSDDSLPSAFSNLSSLRDLDLSYNLFHRLPDCITSLSGLKWLSLRSCDNLHSILGLQDNLLLLNIGRSFSLKKLTFQSTESQLANVVIYNLNKVVEFKGIFKREPIADVDREILGSLGIDIESMENLEASHRGLSHTFSEPIQGLYEFGIFSTFLPGREVPSWFNKNKGSSISFTVCSFPNLRIQCLNVCCVYALYGDSWASGIKINNKTKDLTWIYFPLFLGIPNGDKGMAWLSQWNFGNQLEVGNEVTVSMVYWEGLVVECGINIVYDDGDHQEEENAYFAKNQVIGGDLSSFKCSNGVYFLCRRSLHRQVDKWEKDNFRNAFGDDLDLEDIRGRDLFCGVIHNDPRL